MKSKNSFLLILALGMTSFALLADRFLFSVPDWLSIVLSVLSIASLIVFILSNCSFKKKQNM